VIFGVSDLIFADSKLVLRDPYNMAAIVSRLVSVPTPICYVDFVACELVNTFSEILGDSLGRPHPAIAGVFKVS